jgi:hypothetical protein
MAITIFTIPPMSAGPERIFSGTKHTIGIERLRLGPKMLEMIELLKSWVHIPQGQDHAPLSGVFLKERLLQEAMQVVEDSGDMIRIDSDNVLTLELR